MKVMPTRLAQARRPEHGNVSNAVVRRSGTIERLPGGGDRSRLPATVPPHPQRWCSSAAAAFLVLGGASAAQAQPPPVQPPAAPPVVPPVAPPVDRPGDKPVTPPDVPEGTGPEVDEPTGSVDVDGDVGDGISEEDLDWDDDDDDDGGAVTPPPEPQLSDEEKRALRRERSAQAALEASEPRPPLEELRKPEPPLWEPRLEVGGAFAFVLRPFANAVAPNTGISYKPAPGWGVVLRWTIYDWIAIHPYFIDSHHRLGVPAGALATDANNSIAADATVETNSTTTFAFGAKLAPTWEIIDRLRVWGAVGVGWGRFEFPTMTLTEGDTSFTVEDREGVFIEFPMGLGISYDVIDRWIAVGYEATAAPITGQTGAAHEPYQAVDEDGNTRDVGPLGAIEASIVQTLSVTVIL